MVALMEFFLKSLRFTRFLCFGFLLIASTGCGYRPGYGSFSENYRTISVPYVVGDVDGDLTASIVREVVASLGFDHSTTEGQLILIVEIVEAGDENIGFRFEQLQGKKYKRSIIPVESRLFATVEVSLVDANTGCTIVPTVLLSASIDLDHEYNATYTDSTVPTLGQLTDADSAFEAARIPLNRLLAQKIVEYMSCINIYTPEVNSTEAKLQSTED